MPYGFVQFFIFVLVLCSVSWTARASASRSVILREGEITPVFVEAGYSTLLKFDSHPDSGLLGDQDAFKVEYLRNVVAIKPMISRGQTNLFITTKDGQFGFQIVASKGHHDNTVYVKSRAGEIASGPTHEKTAVLVDDLSTQKIERTVNFEGLKISLLSVSVPRSRSALVFKVAIEALPSLQASLAAITPTAFSIEQGSRTVPLENIFVEPHGGNQVRPTLDVLILTRVELLKANSPAQLLISLDQNSKDKRIVKIPFRLNLK